MPSLARSSNGQRMICLSEEISSNSSTRGRSPTATVTILAPIVSVRYFVFKSSLPFWGPNDPVLSLVKSIMTWVAIKKTTRQIKPFCYLRFPSVSLKLALYKEKKKTTFSDLIPRAAWFLKASEAWSKSSCSAGLQLTDGFRARISSFLSKSSSPFFNNSFSSNLMCWKAFPFLKVIRQYLADLTPIFRTMYLMQSIIFLKSSFPLLPMALRMKQSSIAADTKIWAVIYYIDGGARSESCILICYPSGQDGVCPLWITHSRARKKIARNELTKDFVVSGECLRWSR